MSDVDDLTAPHFHDAERAGEHLETIRWPHGPICPHCGVVGQSYRLEGKGGEARTKARPGLTKCGVCRRQFSVTVGTVFDRTQIPLNKLLVAAYPLCSSKKGISIHELHRTLGVMYEAAWFIVHRIRQAMREDPTAPLGGPDKIVKDGKAYVGPQAKHVRGARRKNRKSSRAPIARQAVVSLVERVSRVRSFHVTSVTWKRRREILWSQIAQAMTLMTDELSAYKRSGRGFANHEPVDHSIADFVRGTTYTNTAGNSLSIVKRGLTGVYQHVSDEHLKRYVCGLTSATRIT